MRTTLVAILLLLLFCPSSFAGGDKKLLKTKRENSIKENQDQQIMDELLAIEKSITSEPEESIKQLSNIVTQAIEQDLKKSAAYAYLLLGRSYRIVQEPTLALNFMELAKEQYDKQIPTVGISSFKGKGNVTTENLPPEYYYDLGMIYSQLGEYQKSNEQLSLYQANNPTTADDTEVDYSIAENHYAAENFDQAINRYNTLLEIEKANSNDLKIRECYSRLAACYISKGETDKGLEYYNKSVSGLENSTNQSEYKPLTKSVDIVSKALKKQNRVKEVIEVQSSAINTLSSDGTEHLRLAQSYYEANDFVQAETSLDNYLSDVSYDVIDTKEIEVIRDMAQNLRVNNKPEKALNYFFTYEQLQDTIKKRLAFLEEKSKRLGAKGYQNMLELEVLKKDKEMSDNMINHLMRESELKEAAMSSQRSLIYLLGFALLAGLGTLIYILRVSKQRRIANQQLALRSLRSQMNPHFIFNALNSVNSFISMSDERSANKFLSEFSTLMRTVMENSEHSFITLTKELEIIKIYMELEHFRFKDKFTYTLDIDETIDEDSFRLPPMLIQPYIENAIWHGLRYKEEKGTLSVAIKNEKDSLKVVVTDDGIGRTKSKEVKTKNQRKTKSTALKNINERIQIFEDLHKIKVSVDITDKNSDGTGTVVTLIIPQPDHD